MPVSMDEFRTSVGKLYSLLEKPEYGLSTWWGFLHDRMKEVQIHLKDILSSIDAKKTGK